MEDFDEKVYDTDGMNFYTISEMTSILNDFGCGYNKKTIANWINDFQTDEHFQKYGEPRKRSFGTQNKKPMEYPQVWFGAVIESMTVTFGIGFLNMHRFTDQFMEMPLMSLMI